MWVGFSLCPSSFQQTVITWSGHKSIEYGKSNDIGLVTTRTTCGHNNWRGIHNFTHPNSDGVRPPGVQHPWPCSLRSWERLWSSLADARVWWWMTDSISTWTWHALLDSVGAMQAQKNHCAPETISESFSWFILTEIVYWSTLWQSNMAMAISPLCN